MTDLELFARLIQCEAGGEGDNGMKAVASVVMNRVRTSVGEYGRYNTIPAVIYQDGQFNCVRTRLSGRTNLQNVYNMNPTNVHYEIAEWAMAAGESLGSALVLQPVFFHMPEQFPVERGVFSNPHWPSLLLQSSAVVCQYLMAKPPSPSAALQGAFPPGKIADAKPSNSATESTPPLTHGRHRAMLMMYTQGGTYFHDTRTRQGCRHDAGQYSAAIY